VDQKHLVVVAVLSNTAESFIQSIMGDRPGARFCHEAQAQHGPMTKSVEQQRMTVRRRFIRTP
jgi:hypothetical protein